MLSPANFIRRSPTPLLSRYFNSLGIELPAGSTEIHDFKKALIQIFEDLPEREKQKICEVAERVSQMADDQGYAALRGVIDDVASFEAHETDLARAFGTFLEDQERFGRAEDVRYLDQQRFGRQWASYKVERAVKVDVDDQLVARLRTALCTMFGGAKVHVEVFRRTRQIAPGDARNDLIQVIIYREGRATEELAFEADELTSIIRKPVLEGSVSYEPTQGIIEVVQKERATRVDIAKLVARELLGKAFDGERIPLRRYDLSSLLDEREFPTDPADHIDLVRVVRLRLQPYGSNARLTIECSPDGATIWSWARANFGAATPMRDGWAVLQAKIIVRFRPTPGAKRGKVLPVTISLPQSCDLKERTTKELLIGEKYLARWGLLERTDASS